MMHVPTHAYSIRNDETRRLPQTGYYLSCDQARYVANEGRCMLALARPQARKMTVARLSWEEERRLIVHAYACEVNGAY